MPIQHQMSQDEDIVTQALGSDLTPGQVLLTDLLGTSDSNIDIDELVQGSDRNLSGSGSSINSVRYARTASQGHVPVRSSPVKRKNVDQDQINDSILTQLNAISDRRTKIENSGSDCRKSPGVSKTKA